MIWRELFQIMDQDGDEEMKYSAGRKRKKAKKTRMKRKKAKKTRMKRKKAKKTRRKKYN